MVVLPYKIKSLLKREIYETRNMKYLEGLLDVKKDTYYELCSMIDGKSQPTDDRSGNEIAYSIKNQFKKGVED